jgi:hypothetical protein
VGPTQASEAKYFLRNIAGVKNMKETRQGKPDFESHIAIKKSDVNTEGYVTREKIRVLLLKDLARQGKKVSEITFNETGTYTVEQMPNGLCKISYLTLVVPEEGIKVTTDTI